MQNMRILFFTTLAFTFLLGVSVGVKTHSYFDIPPTPSAWEAPTMLHALHVADNVGFSSGAVMYPAPARNTPRSSKQFEIAHAWTEEIARIQALRPTDLSDLGPRNPRLLLP